MTTPLPEAEQDSSFFDAITGGLERISGIANSVFSGYSSFLDAKLARDIQRQQSLAPPQQSVNIPSDADIASGLQLRNVLLIGGAAVLFIAGSTYLFKKVF